MICPREQRRDVTDNHYKSIEIISSVATDNNEDNDITLLSMEPNYGPHQDNVFADETQTEKNQVQKLIEQFNVDELMQADEPSSHVKVELNGKSIPRPVKKSNFKDISKGDPEIIDHILEDLTSNEITVHLPHIKKMLPHTEAHIDAYNDNVQDLQMQNPTAIQKVAGSKEIKRLIELPNNKIATSKNLITTVASSTSLPAMAIDFQEVTENIDSMNTVTPLSFTTPIIDTSMHPGIHPIYTGHNKNQLAEPSTKVINKNFHRHRETVESSHFIPPMLLVKSHYVPSNKQHHVNEHIQEHIDAKPNKAHHNVPVARVVQRNKQNENENKTDVTEVSRRPVLSTTETSNFKKQIDRNQSTVIISDEDQSTTSRSILTTSLSIFRPELPKQSKKYKPSLLNTSATTTTLSYKRIDKVAEFSTFPPKTTITTVNNRVKSVDNEKKEDMYTSIANITQVQLVTTTIQSNVDNTAASTTSATATPVTATNNPDELRIPSEILYETSNINKKEIGTELQNAVAATSNKNLSELPTADGVQTSTLKDVNGITPLTNRYDNTVTSKMLPFASTTSKTSMANTITTTTDEPYKPHRHRSLIKPGSVSYIKRILG